MTELHPFHRMLPEQTEPLRRRALKLTSNAHRADDLVQATLLKAWASRNSFQHDTNLRAWLFTILRNTFFSELRKYRNEVQDVNGDFAGEMSVVAQHDDAIALKEIVGAISLLPASQRRPIMLMGLYGFSQREAADMCGCTVGTIKSRVSRGRATLVQRLQDDDELQEQTVTVFKTDNPEMAVSKAVSKARSIQPHEFSQSTQL